MLALPGSQDAGNGAQRRRLSCAVAADERHDLALLDAQRDPMQRLDRAVADRQVFDDQEGHTC